MEEYDGFQAPEAVEDNNLTVNKVDLQ
ncbi:hypothetical protein CCACVL1_25507 [Corchorus capsularis]|uniref:Uncharacterized protein n=1 Tax=Corchorus capsularis TaxID=210143 RepID=A0A1R3GJL9_COCAP|nr:hypothetical protein CCACVL1_25507 [Corchorus capsularis]